MNPIDSLHTMLLPSNLQSANHMPPSPKYKFCCKKCDFYTNKSCNYIDHLNTKKHKVTSITNPVFVQGHTTSDVSATTVVYSEASQITETRKTYPCKICNKPYYSKKGLWQHSKKCKVTTSSISQTTASSEKPSELVAMATLMSEMFKEMFKANQSFMLQVINNKLTEGSANMNSSLLHNPINHAISNSNVSVNGNGNITNINQSNNKTFNLNMFLNEKCKDAMNITEFVQKIELDTEDMEDVGKHGFVKGISNIFISNLKKTEVTKRPIHCSDVKREVLYIKDDDKWERENIDSKKLVDAVRVVEQKNVNLINQWAKDHPECEKSETQANNIYMKLSKNADGNDESIAKVIKNVVHNVVIKKNDYDIIE